MERGLRFERGGVMAEALRCYTEAEAAAHNEAELSEALRRQADVHRLRCDWEEALLRADAAMRIAREAELRDLIAEAFIARAAIEQSRGQHPAARAAYEEALAFADAPRVRGCALQNLGSLAAMAGDHPAAARHFEGSLESFRADGYDRGVAIALNNLGRASLDRGDVARAAETLAEAVGQARAVADHELSAVALVNLAEALIALGDLERAEEEASAALGFFKVSGNVWREAECLKILGDARRARGQAEVARRLYEQALAQAQRVGDQHEADQLVRRLAAYRTETTNPPPVDA